MRIGRPLGPVAVTVLSFAALGLTPTPALPQSACPDPAALTADTEGALAHVRYLADDALEGRDSGTEGERCAAAYIVARFEEMGLQPAGEDGTWFQSFPVRTGTAVRGGMLQILGERTESTSVTWKPSDGEWTPFGFSGSEDVTGELVYDGEGVARPGSGEERAPADGRIVVVEAGTEGSGGLYGDPHFKASVAAGRGAAGVIILLPEGAELPDATTEVRPAVGAPAVAVTGEAAEAFREAARAGGVEARVAADVQPVFSDARNVVAVLPGSDPNRMRELTILGAHYDHLGYGGDGSLSPDLREIHNGADDNASGTAALIEAARLLTEGPAPAGSVLFIAFSGEEMGLLGSAYFVENPTVPISAATAMINMDMVGRLRDNTLTTYGVATAAEWNALLDEANDAAGVATGAGPLVLSRLPDGYGPSDHSSFYGAGIPVLHFFTNTHSVYHRPEDDWDTVNAEGIERVAALAVEVTRRLTGTNATMAVALTPQEGAGNPHGTLPAASDDEEEGSPRSGGYGPYLGTIPDMAPIDHGVRLTGVREDSPAERAGLRGGDVIVEFGGKEVGDLYAYTYALRDFEPGDEVEIVVERDGERVTLTAVLGRRR